MGTAIQTSSALSVHICAQRTFLLCSHSACCLLSRRSPCQQTGMVFTLRNDWGLWWSASRLDLTRAYRKIVRSSLSLLATHTATGCLWEGGSGRNSDLSNLLLELAAAYFIDGETTRHGDDEVQGSRGVGGGENGSKNFKSSKDDI